MISGPIADQLKFRASASYLDTDGWLTNIDTKDQSAKHNADPVKDFNGRLSFLYTPTNDFTVDLRLSTDLLNTRGLYYVVDFTPGHFNNPNYTGQPINLNNSGMDDRKIYDASLKLTDNVGDGTLTSIRATAPSGKSSRRRLLVRSVRAVEDRLRFRPGPVPGRADLQPGSPLHVGRQRPLPLDRGGELFYTQRYISTGNMFDGATDSGVQPI